MLEDTDGEAANQVDDQHQQAGDGIPSHELGGPVHGAVEVGLSGDLLPTGPGLVLIQRAGVEIGIDGHLLARHGIQREAGGDFGDPLSALGDHHKVDDHQDHEDHQTHHIVTADDHLTERLNDFTGGLVPLMTMEQHDPGRGDVQRQPHQGGDQQHSREHGEIERTAGRDRDQQHQHGQHYVEGKQRIQQPTGQGQDHHGQNGQ